LPDWLIIVLVFVALAAGFAANKYWVSQTAATSDDSGFNTSDLVGSITTVAVVLLAFILSEGDCRRTVALAIKRARRRGSWTLRPSPQPG